MVFYSAKLKVNKQYSQFKGLKKGLELTFYERQNTGKGCLSL